MKTFGFYDLIDACGLPGCPLCRLAQVEEHHFLDSLLYEYANEYDVHQRVRASRGLCSRHAWQLTEFKEGVLGVAVLYEQALDELLTRLNGNNTPASAARGMLERWLGPSPGAALAAQLIPTQPCMACQHLDDFAARSLAILDDALTEPRFLVVFGASHGLCLPHFTAALGAMRENERSARLAQIQREKWARLQAELRVFIDKHGDRGGDTHIEVMGVEADSWRRAVAALAGMRTNL